MTASLAFAHSAALSLSPLFGWDWHHHSHHHSPGSAEFDATLGWLLAAVAVVLASGVGFLMGGLLHGGVLLALVGKRRHLFWATPAVNAGLYFPVRAYLLPPEGPLAFAPLGVVLALLCGLLSAALLAPFQALWRRRQAPASAEEERSPVAVLEPLPADEPWFLAFRRGLLAPWDGFRYLCEHPRLWGYGLLPVALNLLITALVLFLLLVAVAAFVAYLHPLFPSGWGWVALEVLCALGSLLLALGLALATWTFLQGVLCGYYQAKLARGVEVQLGLPPGEIQEASWGYQAADACKDTASLLAINGGFLLLHLVPVVGSVAGTAGSLYFDWMLFGAEYLDYPLALRGRGRQEKKEFIRRHRFQTLGLGAVVFVANFVPLGGPVVLTTAVVGGVLLHRRLGGATGEEE